MQSPSIVTFIASATIPAGARVKFITGNATGNIAAAGIGETEIGTAILFQGKSSYAAGDAVGVALMNHPGTRTCIAASAIALGATVKRAASGKVDDAGAGKDFGIALEVAAADGDMIEVLSLPFPSAQTLALTSTNGTAAAAADLAALKVETEKIGDDVRAIFAALQAAGILA